MGYTVFLVKGLFKEVIRMNKISLIVVVLIMLFTVNSYSAGSGMLAVQKGRMITISVDKKSTFVFVPIFASGEKIIGRKPIVCEKVTECTVDKEGLYSVFITPTTTSSRINITIDEKVKNK